MFFRLAVFIIALMLSSGAFSSDLPFGGVITKDGGCKESNGPSCPIWIVGEIDSHMAIDFEATLSRVRKTYRGLLFVHLNSRGGDVSSAMRMGKALRRDSNEAAVILANEKCLSACVFVLAGAVQRFVRGAVGIHRPYYPEVETLPLETRQQRYKQLVQRSKNYLNEMNIRENLMDAMISVPPERMKVLSATELRYYGLNRNDPVFEEMKDDMIARRFGLSRDEYLKRKKLTEQQCTDPNNFNVCVASIMKQ